MSRIGSRRRSLPSFLIISAARCMSPRVTGRGASSGAAGAASTARRKSFRKRIGKGRARGGPPSPYTPPLPVVRIGKGGARGGPPPPYTPPLPVVRIGKGGARGG